MQVDLKQRKYRGGMILNVPLLRGTPLKKEKLGFEQLRKLLVFLLLQRQVMPLEKEKCITNNVLVYSTGSPRGPRGP